MRKTALHWLGRSLVVVAAFLTGCADEAPLGLDRRPMVLAPLAADHHRVVDLGPCGNLQVPAGNRLAYHVYATGVQIYRWNGTSWSFVAPEALLFADAGGNGTVGTHYAGPTWESVSGSKVVGAFVDRCTPDATAIPWLLLGAVSTEGPGIFEGVTFIQRVNTVGGLAPAGNGSFTGEEIGVPYTTEYYFYRAQ